MPLLAPSDGVPFACFLMLHGTPASSADQAIGVGTEQQISLRALAAAQDDIQELVYILAGDAQVKCCKADAQAVAHFLSRRNHSTSINWRVAAPADDRAGGSSAPCWGQRGIIDQCSDAGGHRHGGLQSGRLATGDTASHV